MCGFCSRDDRVHPRVQRLLDAWISRRDNVLRHADSSLLISRRAARLRSGSRSGSIRPKLSLAWTVTMILKGQFRGSPQLLMLSFRVALIASLDPRYPDWR